MRYLDPKNDLTFKKVFGELQNPEIKEALEYIQESAFTKGELEAYDRYWDSIRSEKSLMQGAADKGRVEGIIKGGKLQAYKTCLKCIRKNMTDDEISYLTDLSVEMINKLHKLSEKYGINADEHLDDI